MICKINCNDSIYTFFNFSENPEKFLKKSQKFQSFMMSQHRRLELLTLFRDFRKSLKISACDVFLLLHA